MYESGYASSSGGTMVILLWLVLYLYFAFTQFKIAQKVNHNAPWWAFIPIVNLFQQIQMAGKEWYWFILYLVPVVNIFAIAIIWMNIAQRCQKSSTWGILAILPILNFIAWGYLAFSGSAPSSPPPQPAPREHEPVG